MKRLIGILLCAAAFFSVTAQATKTLDGIVAVVNDEVITGRELDHKVEQVVRQIAKRGEEVPPREVLARQVLDRLVYEKVQVQYARETSIRIDDAMLERALARIASTNKLTLEQFRAALEKDGIAWDSFREDIRNEIALSRLRDREVESRVVVADAEVDAFLAAYPADTEREVEVAHILLRVPDGATPQQWESIKKKADEVLRRAQGGEDFSKLATAVSEAPDALNGGNMGWRKIDRLPSLYADAVRTLPPGAFAPILRSTAGLHIVKLIDARGGGAAGPTLVAKTHARHILIKTSETVSDAEARQRLEQIAERVQRGADFAEQAKRYSNDGSAPKGGDLGWLSPGDTVPEFEQAMNTLKVGEIGAPVQSPFGWHLIQVLERKSEDVSNEMKRGQARSALRERKAEDAYEEFVRQLRDRAFVEMKGAYADKSKSGTKQ